MYAVTNHPFKGQLRKDFVVCPFSAFAALMFTVGSPHCRFSLHVFDRALRDAHALEFRTEKIKNDLNFNNNVF